MTNESDRPTHWVDEEAAERKARRTLAAIVLTLVLVTSAYRILVLHNVQHTSLVFIGLPALAAFSLLYTRPQTAIGTINKVIAILLCLSGILFGEGLVCILFAAPIFFLIGTIVGWIVNRITGRRDPTDPSSGNWRGVVALAVVPLSAEGLAPALSFNRHEQVTVTRVIPAEPNEVRAALARAPVFDRDLPRFFKLGFPTPMPMGNSGLGVGDERRVMFAHGQHHNGELVMRVAAADSASTLFTVMGDSSYITHWLAWESAAVRWEPVAPGRTQVTWTLAYRRRLDPAWYFAPIERYGVRLAAGYLIETLATPRPPAGREPVDTVTLIRATALYVPLCLAGIAWLATADTRRGRAAVLLATMWNIPALMAVHTAARHFGWWSYGVSDATLAGFPVDLLVGWAVGWGALPALLGRRAPLPTVVLLAVIVDVVAMPRLAPVVHLDQTWLLGEAVAVALCLIPAQLLAEWTRRDARLRERAALQALAFSGLTLGVLPAAILQWSGGSWEPLVSRPRWVTGIVAQLIAAAGLLGVSAVQEFAVRGAGTPVPFDPAKRLVTTGPYSYVRNPMQVSASLVMLGWGLALASWWVAAAGAMAVVYGAGFAAGDEGVDLERRFGPAWRTYSRRVRSWLPRWRPVGPSPSDGGPAMPTLYVAEECGRCSQVRRWFESRMPIALQIVAAERHPSRSLTRITYDPGDGTADATGVAALGRALEHLNLAWAMLGMFVRLPGVCWLIQVVTDASGGGPTLARRYCDRPLEGVRGR